MPSLPNIVYIFTDQMRGDCLSAAGHPVVKTPTLDELAYGGAVFTRAYSACPSCIAARACMWTGLSPNSVGRIGYRDCVPWRYETTLMTELAAAGYQCHCVGKTHFYPQRTLLGFHSHESYEANQNLDGDYVNDYFEWLKIQPGGPYEERMHGLDSNSWVASPSILPDHLHVNAWTVTRSIEFIKRRDYTKPFFLNVSFHRPHAPTDPPREFFHMYDDVELPPVPTGDWCDEFDVPATEVNAAWGRISQFELDRFRRAYWGQVSHIDNQINRLIVYLKRNGIYDNTIIIFSSDHGELLGDHFLYRKTHSLEGSTRIPFIVRAPKRFGFEAGLVSDKVITHMDLMPSVLEMAGLAVPGGLEGSSIVPILRGEDTQWREYLHGEHSGLTNMKQHGGMQYVVSSRYKYTWFTQSGRELFFDMADDPGEERDLTDSPDHYELVEEFRGRLVEELAMRPEDGLADGGKLIPGRTLPAVRPALLEPYLDNEGRPRPARLMSGFE
ncbi:MAG: arylsulfatase [Planctomycetes bacterium]|nr:arylsulfatase [Planctomycetota bacterium]